MNTATDIAKKSSGQRLKNTERQVLILKLIDYLCEGYHSTNSLAKKLRVSRDTVNTYRSLADEIIARQKLDRNVIRNLQVRRTYELIELLMDDLRQSREPKHRALYYNQIYKFSSHLALITGLNVETHVIADPTKLVIIRANNNKKQDKRPVVDVTGQSDSV